VQQRPEHDEADQRSQLHDLEDVDRRAASRPATAMTTIAVSQPTIHAAAVRGDEVAAGMAPILAQRRRLDRPSSIAGTHRTGTTIDADAFLGTGDPMTTTSYDAIVIGAGQAGRSSPSGWPRPA
jgi:hypothetical protein